uniref:Amino acid transporter transmembrane domain-containing protein n=1 Tax=Megaselia scalaris TaxID=36166 RepID=T1GKP0_MEGSC
MHINHHVMTLANSIIGVGILAMPYCFQKCGVILSILLLVLSNLITRSCCHFLIKSSLLTRRKSIEFLALHAFGASGKLLVELMIVGYMIGTCVAYFVVLGDLGPQILSTWFHFDPSHNIREWLMIVVTLFCILPLGMLKNVDSLAAVCTASIGFYFCLVIKIVFESEHHILENDWEDKIIYGGQLDCYSVSQFSVWRYRVKCKFLKSLKSVEKLDDIVKNALTICCIVYISCGFFGYVAFCNKEFSGNILTSFSPTFASDVIRIGFLLSVCFSFPLVIFPCRASIFSFMYKKDSSHFIPEGPFRGITIFIIVVSLFLALLIPSIELVIGLVGSTIGIAICIMFPAACFRRIIKKESNEKTLAQIIVAGGFILMILGTYANLNAIDEKRSGAHLASDIQQKIPEIQQSTPTFRLKEEPIVIVHKNVSITAEKKKDNPKFSPISPQPEPEIQDLELKKTKDELKLTKELLEKKVGQLKEAQDLVVEKLGEVVDKVEEIAKEIKDDKQEDVPVVKEVPKVEDILLKVQEIKRTIDVDSVALPKDSLIDRLTKNGSKNGVEKLEAKEEKVEKLVEVTKDIVKKVEEVKNIEEIKKVDDLKAKVEPKVTAKVEPNVSKNSDPEVQKEEPKVVKPIPLAVLINSSKVDVPGIKKEESPVIVKNETAVKEEDLQNANIEAIRRDLLEEKKPEDPPIKVVKRSVEETQKDCTKKPSKHSDET